MNPHLILLQRGKHSILIRYPERILLIRVDRNLSEEKEERLLSGVYSDGALDEMGLTRETIRLSDLRGVALSGPDTGDTVTLYIGKQKRTWQLSDDSTQSDLDAIFQGVERFQAPKSRKEQDQRQSAQDASTMNYFLIFGNILNVVSFISAFCVVFGLEWGYLFPIAGMVLVVLSFGLYLAFPQYYSILGRKEYKKAGYTASVCHLDLALIFAPMILGIQTLRGFTFLNWTPLVTISVAGGVILGVLVICFSPELKKHMGTAVLLTLVLMLGTYGIIGQVNHMANMDTTHRQTCVVQGKARNDNRRGPDSYTCTVMLENGETLELPISRQEYEGMDRGDLVLVHVGPGALGIEYAYLVDLAPGFES